MAVEVGKTGTIRLTGKDIVQLREDCFVRDGGRCVRCKIPLRRERGYLLNSMHMAHKRGRGAGGSDTLENVEAMCPQCHLVEVHNPKSVPKKVK